MYDLPTAEEIGQRERPAYDPSRIGDVTAGELEIGDVLLAVAGVDLPIGLEIDSKVLTDDRAGVWLSAPGWYPEQPIPVTEAVRRAAAVWALEGDDAGVHGLYGSRQAAMEALDLYAEALDYSEREVEEMSDGSAILEDGQHWLAVNRLPLLARELRDGETS